MLVTTRSAPKTWGQTVAWVGMTILSLGIAIFSYRYIFAAGPMPPVIASNSRFGPIALKKSGCRPAQAGSGCFTIGMSLAILRRFWAVAAIWNSSLAPFGPRRRNRSSFRMRLRCANSISTFFRWRRDVT